MQQLEPISLVEFGEKGTCPGSIEKASPDWVRAALNPNIWRLFGSHPIGPGLRASSCEPVAHKFATTHLNTLFFAFRQHQAKH